MKRWMTVGLVAVALTAGVVMLRSAGIEAGEPIRPIPTTEEPQTSAFMERKLDAAHRILSGVMTEEFDSIAKAADDLLRLSRAAEWNVVNDDAVYSHFSTEFQRQATKLANAARAKDLEKATFAWQRLTSSCVDCHQHVRDVVRVGEGENNPRR